MAEFSVEQKRIIDNYRFNNGLSSVLSYEAVVSIMEENGDSVTLDALKNAKETSVFGFGYGNDCSIGDNATFVTSKEENIDNVSDILKELGLIMPRELDKNLVEEFENLGITSDTFYNRLHFLSEQQITNVKDVIKYCKENGITNEEDINKTILQYYPHLNLFDENPTALTEQTERGYIAQFLYEQVNQMWQMMEGTYYSSLANQAGMEISDALSMLARGVNNLLGYEVLSEGDITRKDFHEELGDLREKCLKLLSIAEIEAKEQDEDFQTKLKNNDKRKTQFEKTYTELFPKKEVNYKLAEDYIKAVSAFQNAPESEKNNPNSQVNKDMQEANNKFAEEFYSINSLQDKENRYLKTTSTIGGLGDLAFNIALLYLSGGGSAIAKLSQGSQSVVRNNVGNALAKTTLSDGTQFAIKEGAGILSSVHTNAALTAAFFQGTKIINAVGDGKITKEESDALAEGYIDLYKFMFVGATVTGPIGIKAGELLKNTIESEPVITSTLKLVASKPNATVTDILKGLAENSNTVAKVTSFGTTFFANAGYMALDDGVSYAEGLKNLGQMEGVSKMVMAFLGKKGAAYMTPVKMRTIKAEFDNINIKMVVYKGQSMYELTDKTTGEKSIIDTPENFMLMITDKIAKNTFGEKSETEVKPQDERAKEEIEVKSEESTTDVEISDIIQNYMKANFKRFDILNDNKIKSLISNICKDANNDINVIKSRLEILNKYQDTGIVFLVIEEANNAGFLIDNYEIIFEKIFKSDSYRKLFPLGEEFKKVITKDTLQEILQHIGSSDFQQFATKLIYDSKEHNVKFGSETVKIKSEYIIALLSGRQSLSYYTEGSCVSFNRAINQLVEASCRTESDYECPYYKLAEGILAQKPELAKLAKEYQNYMNQREKNQDIVEYGKNFYETMEKSGRLQEEIDLRTIVPDENALLEQKELLDIFIERSKTATGQKEMSGIKSLEADVRERVKEEIGVEAKPVTKQAEQDASVELGQKREVSKEQELPKSESNDSAGEIKDKKIVYTKEEILEHLKSLGIKKYLFDFWRIDIEKGKINPAIASELFDAVKDNTGLLNELSGLDIFYNLNPENVSAKIEFYNYAKQKISEMYKLATKIKYITKENLTEYKLSCDVEAKETEYFNENINLSEMEKQHLKSGITDILDKYGAQFVLDNFEIIAKYNFYSHTITPENIEMIKTYDNYLETTGREFNSTIWSKIVTTSEEVKAKMLESMNEEMQIGEIIQNKYNNHEVMTKKEAKILLNKMFDTPVGGEDQVVTELLEKITIDGEVVPEAIELIEFIEKNLQLAYSKIVLVDCLGHATLSKEDFANLKNYIQLLINKGYSNSGDYDLYDGMRSINGGEKGLLIEQVSQLLEKGVPLKEIDSVRDLCSVYSADKHAIEFKSENYQKALEILSALSDITDANTDMRNFLIKKFNSNNFANYEEFIKEPKISIDFINKMLELGIIENFKDLELLYPPKQFPVKKIELEALNSTPKEKLNDIRMCVFNNINELNIDIYKTLVEKSGEQDFNWYQIEEVLAKITTKELADLVKDALNKSLFVDKHGELKFASIVTFTGKYTSESKDIFNKLVSNNINLSELGYSLDEIIEFVNGKESDNAPKLNEAQFEFFIKLLQYEHPDNNIYHIRNKRSDFIKLPSEAYPLLEKLLQKGKPLNKIIKDLTDLIDNNSVEILKSEQMKEILNNPDIIEYFDISDYIKWQDKANLLLSHKDLLKSFNSYCGGTGALLESIDIGILQKGFGVLKDVPQDIKNGNPESLAIIYIVEIANQLGMVSKNKDGQYIKDLYKQAYKYDKDYASKIIDVATTKAESGKKIKNVEAAIKLDKQRNLSGDGFERVLLSDTTIDYEQRQKTLEALLKDKEKIIKAIQLKCQNTDTEFAEKAEKLLSDDYFQETLLFLPNLSLDTIVNNFYETAKIIHYVELKPQDYINGDYSNEVITALKDYRKNGYEGLFKNLSREEQNTISEINSNINNSISDKIVEMFDAIASTDIETVKLLLDKRFEIFNEKREEINNLDVGDKFVIADLIRNGKRINKKGQPDKLSGQQKIDIINLVKIARGCNCDFDFSKYKTPVQKGAFILDLDALRKDIISIILKSRGLTEEEIARIKPENSAWNSKYVSSLTITKPQDKGELSTLVQETSKGTFNEFIEDTSNIYGQANAKTKQEFLEANLSFEQWEHPDIPDMEFDLSGKKVKLKIWPRNPLEDIFIGAKTNCCTDLSGTNGAATAMFMMNKAFQVIEMYDSLGNTVAMARVFMAKIDGKPSLMIDCFEMNTEFIKGVNTTELRNAYYSYLNQYVEKVTGDKNAKVYSYADETHVDLSDLPKVEKSTDFIGSIHRDDIYINSTHFKWYNPKNLKNFDYGGTKGKQIPWRIVPKEIKEEENLL